MSAIDFHSHLRCLHPYVHATSIEAVAGAIGAQVSDIVKLASNENPLGACPRALQALKDESVDVSRYPDNDASDLTAELARHYDVPADWVIAGAGSESLISIVASMVLCQGRSAVFSEYSFQAFVNATQRCGATSIVVPSPRLVVDLDALRLAVRDDTSLIYIANPGNPTGTAVDATGLHAFVAQVPARVAVLIDEAYFEYMPNSLRVGSIDLVRRHNNVILTRTFSKAYGLAGLRVGYAFAQREIADVMRHLRAPFSVTRIAQTAAVAALGDSDFLAQTYAVNEAGRRCLNRELDSLRVERMPSATNFVLARVGSGTSFAKRAAKAGIIVRPVHNYGLPNWVRISIGTEPQIDKLLPVLRAHLACSA